MVEEARCCPRVPRGGAGALDCSAIVIVDRARQTTILLERRVRDLRRPSYSPLGLVPQTLHRDLSHRLLLIAFHRPATSFKDISDRGREVDVEFLDGREGRRIGHVWDLGRVNIPADEKSSSIPLSTSACRGCTSLTSDTLDSPRRLASGPRPVRDSRFSRCCDVEDDGRPLCRTRSLRALRRRAFEPFETGHLDDCVSGSANDYETGISVTKRKA